MLHQVVDSLFIHHDVLHVGPSTPYFSLPMIIMLGVFDDSVTDSLTEASSSWFDLLLSVLNNFCSEQLLQSCCSSSTLRNSWRYLSMMSRTTYCNLDDQQDRSLYHTDPAFVIAQLARSVLDSLCQDFHTVSWNPNLFSTTDVNKRVWRHFSPKSVCTWRQ